MLNGFVCSVGKHRENVSDAALCVAGRRTTGAIVLKNSFASYVKKCTGDNREEDFFIGTLSNRADLMRLIQKHVPSYRDQKEHQILATLHQIYGTDGFRFVEGLYACMVVSEDSVLLVASKTPGPTLYYCLDADAGTVWVSTELKGFPEKERTFRSFDDLSEQQLLQDPTETIYNNVQKVGPGTVVQIGRFNDCTISIRQYYSPLASLTIWEESGAVDRIYGALYKAVSAIDKKKISCLISGGLDSSVIGYLCLQLFKDVDFYSIGTETHNEFDKANQFAHSVGKQCNCIVFEENDFYSAFREVIRIVEHCHSKFIEYLTPVYIAHHCLPKDAQTVISGYGSDILFAGFAGENETIADISRLIWSEYQTSYWSNETSHVFGGCLDQDIYYPFFDSAVVDAAFQIDPSLKYKEKIPKYILRRTFQNKIINPILWGKKVGIHQGTGCESFWTKYLDLEGLEARRIRKCKDYFAYSILKKILQNEENLSCEDLKKEVSKYRSNH